MWFRKYWISRQEKRNYHLLSLLRYHEQDDYIPTTKKKQKKQFMSVVEDSCFSVSLTP